MTTTATPHRLHERLCRDPRRGLLRPRHARAVCHRRQPLPDRVLWASSCRGRSRTSSRPSGSPPRRGCRSCPAGPRPASRGRPSGGDRHRLLEVSEPDRRRRSRHDDGPGRAGGRARPAQRAPQAAGPDVRARRLDQRPRDARRDDRQQLGRGPVAAVWQDGRSRPRASTSSWPTAPRRRSARSPTPSSTPICAGPTALGKVHRVGPRRRGRARQAIAAQFPQILRRVSGYNLDEFVPGLPVRPVGWPEEPWQFNLARLIVGSEGTLAVVTGAELKLVPVPAGAGPGGAFVRHDPRRARPAGRDRRDRPGRRRDARPDDPRAGGEEPALFALPQLRRGPPRRRPGRAVLRRQPGRAGRAGRRPGAAVRGTARRARRPQATDRRRQGRLLEGAQGRVLALDGPGRRRQADRVRRGHGRRSRAAARVLRPVPRDRRAPGGDRRLLWPRRRRLPAHPADHQRQDGRGDRAGPRRSRARSPTWSSSSAAR